MKTYSMPVWFGVFISVAIIILCIVNIGMVNKLEKIKEAKPIYKIDAQKMLVKETGRTYYALKIYENDNGKITPRYWEVKDAEELKELREFYGVEGE